MGRPETSLAFNVDGTVSEQRVKNPNDADGWVTTTFGYDGLGRLHTTTTEDAADLANGDGLVTTTQWLDAAGNMTRTLDHFGLETQAAFDSANLLVAHSVEQPRVTIAGVAGENHLDVYRRTNYEYNAAGIADRQYITAVGGPLASPVQYGDGISFEYDNLGRITKRTQEVRDGSGGTANTLFEYDVFGYRTKLTDPLSNVTTTTSDELGRVVAEITSHGTRSYTFDSFGNLLQSNDRLGRVIQHDYDNLGRRTKESWPGDSYVAHYHYTALGELTTAQDAADEGLVSSYSYDYDAGRRLALVDQQFGHLAGDVSFSYQTDLVGQVTQVVADLPGGDNDYQNDYVYDNLGRITSVQQSPLAGSNIHTKTVTSDFEYRAEGTPSQLVLTEFTRRYANDLSSAVAASTKKNTFGNGATWLIHHYLQDLPASASQGHNPTDTLTVARNELSYDPRGLIVQKDVEAGSLQYATTSTTTNNYDHMGQLVKSDRVNPGGSDPPPQTFEYDTHGNRIDDGSTVDSFNRLTYSAPTGSRYEYDAEGNVTARWKYNKLDAAGPKEPDADHFPLTIGTLGAGSYRIVFSGVVVDQPTFEVQLAYETSGTDPVVFSTTVNAEFVATGEYVLNKSLEFTLDESINDENIYIDFDGNSDEPEISSGLAMLQGSPVYETFAWDHRNRLIKFTRFVIDTDTGHISRTEPISNQTVQLSELISKEYTYDIHNLLVATEQFEYASGATPVDSEEFVYDRGHAVARWGQQGVCDTQIRLYAGGVDMPVVVETESDGFREVAWTLTDHTGTVKHVTGLDENGDEFTTEVAYSAFGEPQSLSKAGHLGGVTTLFAGRDYDLTTGLYNNRARWYDPAAGRFISEDPIGFASGDTNLYRYVFNSPDNATDPSGEVFFIPFLVMAGKAALTYLATQAAISAVETTIEAGISSAMGAEFDWGVSFGKNFAINSATGGIGSKGKWAHKAAAYLGRQGIEIAGDTAVDVGYYGNDLGSSLMINTIGSVGGEALAKGIAKGVRGVASAHPRLNPANYSVGPNGAGMRYNALDGSAFSIIRRSGSNPRATGWFDEAAVLEDMASSSIGRRVLEAAKSDVFRLEFSDSLYRQSRSLNSAESWNTFGMAFRKKAKVYLPAVGSNARAATTAIHEGVHMLGVQGSRRAEALARLAEISHRGGAIDRATMRRVLTEIRQARLEIGGKSINPYEALRWRLGAPGVGKRSPHFPELEF